LPPFAAAQQQVRPGWPVCWLLRRGDRVVPEELPKRGLFYVRTYGQHLGLVLTPVISDGGCYIVGCKNMDETPVPRSEVPDLVAYLRKTGYRVRMGATGHRPSLIHWTSIQGSE
jgi:hypothetical protein